MAYEWRNNKQPVNGEYIVDLDPEDGSQVQTFKGASIEEVTDKLLDAQMHGTRRINELRKEVTPDAKKTKRKFTPRKLSADEEFKVQNDMRSGNVQDAVSTVVEAALGAPLAEVRNRFNEQDEREAYDSAFAQSKAFAESTPEWDPTEENKLALTNYMEAEGMAFTTKNFRIAFERMMEGGLLTRKPDGVEAPESSTTERIVPQQTTRPRGTFATGIRSTDISGTRMPATTKPRYTRQEIENMPKKTYADKMMNEAGFADTVDRLFQSAKA
jgi:hypothetical protein